MAFFELSAKRKNNGRRDFKMVLHEIYPDSCIKDKIGTMFNGNGICWIEQYVLDNMDSVKGMSLTAEFLNKEKTELNSHGLTDQKDGIPIFENAEIIGNFSHSTIEDVEINNETKRCHVGHGEIDEMRYYNFVQELEKRFADGSAPLGSVEIVRQIDQDQIVYQNGKFEQGRIPTHFCYSGFAVLGIEPADKSCVMLELNEQKEEIFHMDEIKKMFSDLCALINENTAAKQTAEELNAQIAEQNASVAQLQAALEEIKKERQALDEKYNQLWAETELLRQEVAKAKVKERVGELNSALVDYTEEEKKYAETEINAFNADPMSVEINSIVDKINIEIGKATKAAAKVAAEQNALEKQHVDIFQEVHSADNDKDVSIF